MCRKLNMSKIQSRKNVINAKIFRKCDEKCQQNTLSWANGQLQIPWLNVCIRSITWFCCIMLEMTWLPKWFDVWARDCRCWLSPSVKCFTEINHIFFLVGSWLVVTWPTSAMLTLTVLSCVKKLPFPFCAIWAYSSTCSTNCFFIAALLPLFSAHSVGYGTRMQCICCTLSDWTLLRLLPISNFVRTCRLYLWSSSIALGRWRCEWLLC